MDVIILPGYSDKNLQWAVEAKEVLAQSHMTAVFKWKHWSNGKAEPGWIEKAVHELDEQITMPTGILAKSIGALVAMKLMQRCPQKIERVILCGIPLAELSDEDKQNYEVVKAFGSEKIVCFQNETDHLGNFDDVFKFMASINPGIKVYSRPRSDHHYPYYSEFLSFFDSTKGTYGPSHN